MGRLEKIVVLTVLFLVAVVLGVALTPTGNPNQRGQKNGTVANGAGDQLGKDKAAKTAENDRLLNINGPEIIGAPAPNPNDPKVTQPSASPDPKQGGVATPTPPAAPKAPEPAKFILTTEGLKPSGAADMMFYAWKQGDSFAALATRFYGSKDKLSRLEKANEGRTEASMKVDDLLWIPVTDSSQANATPEGGKVYVVKAGDMLSGISQQFYGTAKKWQKILDANRDTLSGPEKLKPGMRLRIPE